ncbi:DUF882 domain-containing protein [Pseudaminobacter salicylatoxidans]|uniref:DUF882 domain-containing protein n=1 Tax=Pseudaminobacter salicylatoxidans TaxID=93369 RepID=UPI0002F9F3B0|nr:DUF882 domain-containing protein [Pseudaminobacter salicylatoxidans]
MITIERPIKRRDLEPTGWRKLLAASLIAFGFLTLAAASASAETRALKLYFVHTGEKDEIVYKRNGRYDPAGLKKINHFLRDWRRNEPTKMDPRLLDLIWETYRATGSRQYINVVSAYRSPATNSMLRGRTKGVAKSSQHMLGKAMDFYIPGVPLKKLREIGLKLEAGGVGYYPTSGSPFVHFDVGNVRHWPRMSRKELVALFPNGKTLHVPSDGKPLPGFQQALAAYESRKSSGELAIAMAGSSSTKRSGGLLAALFGGGGGADEEEDNSPVVASAARAPAPKVTVKPAEPAARPAPAPAGGGIQILSPDEAQRADIPGVTASQPEQPVQTPETIIAALPARSVPVPALAPRPQVAVGEAMVASAAAPANIPFGMAREGAQPEATVQEVAFNVPLPTHRPDYTPVVADEQKPQDAILLALADKADSKPRAALASAMVPLPSGRPAVSQADMVVAALPQVRPTLPEQPATEQAASAADAAAVAAELEASKARMAALTNATGMAAERTVNAETVIAPAVKTTAKAARATAQPAKADRKPVTVAAAPEAANWVLRSDYVAQATEGTKAPSFAYNVVRTAPREVYTAGFQQGNQVADASRFTGKAVQFLSVARFETN